LSESIAFRIDENEMTKQSTASKEEGGGKLDNKSKATKTSEASQTKALSSSSFAALK
jgi:hypothetical protein